MEENCREYGGVVGPNSQYIKLISSDGHEFIVQRQLALESKTIANMITDDKWRAYETVQLYFPEIESLVFYKVCTYFAYKAFYTLSSEEIPKFKILPQMALDIAMAADFLDC